MNKAKEHFSRLPNLCRHIANLFAWFLIMVLGLSAAQAAELVEVYPEALANPIQRQIRFNLTIENPTGKMLNDQDIWFYAPVKRTATQQGQKLDVTMPYQNEEDVLGNQIIKLHFAQFPPYGTKLVSIRADLLMSGTPSPSTVNRPDFFLDQEK